MSTSCFEHDQMFWLTFAEMRRVLKPSGYIYINAPSNGAYNSYPYDNWRLYPDAGLALEAWAERQSLKVRLVESFVAGRKGDIWNDFVAVFTKGDAPATAHYLADSYAKTYNASKLPGDSIENFSADSEDMLLRAKLEQQLASKDVRICNLSQELAAAKIELDEIYRSHSWRLTAPFRGANRLFRRLLGR